MDNDGFVVIKLREKTAMGGTPSLEGGVRFSHLKGHSRKCLRKKECLPLVGCRGLAAGQEKNSRTQS